MLSTKFLFTLIGIFVAILAICNVDFSKPVVENFWGNGNYAPRAIPVMDLEGEQVALGGNYLNPSMMGSNKFVSVPSFQANLSPRFDTNQYGAMIRYNMPDKANMAAPCDPLTFGSMVTEKYTPQVEENYECANCGSGACSGGCGPSCGKGAYGMGHGISGECELPVGYTTGNYQKIYDKLPNDDPSGKVYQSCTNDTSNSQLPVGTMTTLDGSGRPTQAVVSERFVVGMKKSRSFAQGDFIRGDLAPAPCQQGWFSVYPNITADLNPGALFAMAGEGNVGGNYQDLMNLLTTASGGSINTFGGSTGQVNLATQTAGTVSQGLSSINYTAFP